MNSLLFLFVFFILWGGIAFGTGWYAREEKYNTKRREKNRALGPVSLRAITERRRMYSTRTQGL